MDLLDKPTESLHTQSVCSYSIIWHHTRGSYLCVRAFSGHDQRLPGDVPPVRLRLPLLRRLSHGRLLGAHQQRDGDPRRRLQAVPRLSAPLLAALLRHRRLAGECLSPAPASAPG